MANVPFAHEETLATPPPSWAPRGESDTEKPEKTAGSDGRWGEKADGYTLLANGACGEVRRSLANPVCGVPNGVPKQKNMRLEGKRMVSGHTGNVVLRKELWVRIPCPPL